MKIRIGRNLHEVCRYNDYKGRKGYICWCADGAWFWFNTPREGRSIRQAAISKAYVLKQYEKDFNKLGLDI